MNCRVHACPKEGKAPFGLCWAHYNRYRRYGHPQGSAPKVSHADKIRSRMHCGTGCWFYPYHGTDRAPRTRRADGRMVRLCVVLWEDEYGPIPDGARLVSVCGHPKCVKPDHHELRERAA